MGARREYDRRVDHVSGFTDATQLAGSTRALIRKRFDGNLGRGRQSGQARLTATVVPDSSDDEVGRMTSGNWKIFFPFISLNGKNSFQMARRSSAPLPPVSRALQAMGRNIRLARTRRGLTSTLLAERAGTTRPTLRSIERGEPGVTIGAIANVLHSLGLSEDLARIAADDPIGRHLEDAKLEAKQRVVPRKS